MAAPPPGTPEVVPFTRTVEHQQIQPLVVGHLISFTLFGIGLLQFFYVARQFDQIRLQGGKLSTMDQFHLVMVALLFVSDIVDAVYKGIFLDGLIENALLGGVQAMAFMPRSVFALCFTDGWTASVTHVIYTVRIVRINRHIQNQVLVYACAVFAMATSVLQFVGSIMTGIKAWGPAAGWEEEMKVSAKLWLGGAAVCDWFLCIVFVVSLVRHRSDFQSTNYIIARWVIFTLETGILVSALQALDLAFFLAYQSRTYHIVCAVIIPKLYTISILIMLHLVYSNRLAPQTGGVTTSSHNFVNSRHDNLGASKTQQRSAINGIKVTSELHTQHDQVELPRMRGEKYDPESFGTEAKYHDF